MLLPIQRAFQLCPNRWRASPPTTPDPAGSGHGGPESGCRLLVSVRHRWLGLHRCWLYLAAAPAAGARHRRFDVVDTANLQRQVIHGTSWWANPRNRIRQSTAIAEINPHCQVESLTETALNPATNALEDHCLRHRPATAPTNFPTRYLVNQTLRAAGSPNVYGSIFRFRGSGHGVQLPRRAQLPRPYPNRRRPANVPSCAEGGVVGVLPGISGNDPGERKR